MCRTPTDHEGVRQGFTRTALIWERGLQPPDDVVHDLTSPRTFPALRKTVLPTDTATTTVSPNGLHPHQKGLPSGVRQPDEQIEKCFDPDALRHRPAMALRFVCFLVQEIDCCLPVEDQADDERGVNDNLDWRPQRYLPNVRPCTLLIQPNTLSRPVSIR